MNIKAEEVSTGEVNVTISTTVLVKSWETATTLINDFKNSVASYEVKR